MLVVYSILLRAAFTYQIKYSQEAGANINLANQLTIKTVIPLYSEISRRQLKWPDLCLISGGLKVRGERNLSGDEFM